MTIAYLPSDRCPLTEAIDPKSIDPAEFGEHERQAELRRELLSEIRSVAISVLGSDLDIQVFTAIASRSLSRARLARWRGVHRSSVSREFRQLEATLADSLRRLLRNKPEEVIRLLRPVPDLARVND